MLLERDETILFANHETSVKGKSGTLYITNKRVLFETQVAEKFHFGSKAKMRGVIVEEVRHGDLMDVTVDDSVKPSLLKLVAKKGIIGVVASDPDQLRTYIVKAKGFKNSQSAFLDKGVVVKVRCAYCGLMVDRNLPKCPSCGAPLEK